MHAPARNFKPLLIGGASLAVVCIAVLNTQHLQDSVPGAATYGPAVTARDETSEIAQTTRSIRQYNRGLLFEDAGSADSSRFAPSEHRSVDTEAAGAGRALQESRDVMLSPLHTGKYIGGGDNDVPTVAFAEAIVEAPAILANRSLAAQGKSAPSSAEKARMHSLQPGYASHADALSQSYKAQGRDKFSNSPQNPVKLAALDPVSTFSIDVDTAAYAFMRAALSNNVLPQQDAVRVEELINYFPYDYPKPQDRSEPFRTHVSITPTPWNVNTKLMHIGIKGYELPTTAKPRSNLVFLIDSSGSMNATNKLPLLRNSFKLMLTTLEPDDTVAIVTYAGSAGTVLTPTPVSDRAKIIAALEQLRSGGSTAGAEGIRQAYQLAERNFDKTGVNRVILATDGDFNVGITDKDELKSYIERKRESGVFLSVLGFGMGNYNDELMQTLAQNGNGNASYIDSLSEARKVLVDEAGSTLFTIAKDVKIQVEFNPRTVAEYRLVGYETRVLSREDFNNDKVDAGDIGAGHTVTAIYELTPTGSAGRLIDDLRYDQPQAAAVEGRSNEYAFVKLRYKLPDSNTSTLISSPVSSAQEVQDITSAPRETRFATAVAAFGQLLRGGRYTDAFDYDGVIHLARGAKGDDEYGYRAEFINLVRLAKSAAALEALDR